jgi:hypothetical protein
MITIAIGCFTLGRLYAIVIPASGGQLEMTFRADFLALIGCFLFFFCANFGQMDSLCDMENKTNRKIRWYALLAPVLMFVVAILVLFVSKQALSYRITATAVIISIMLASYFNYKHLLIIDVENGIIGSIRGYNLMALLLEIICALALVFDSFGFEYPNSVLYVLLLVCIVLIIPALKRGIGRWKI